MTMIVKYVDAQPGRSGRLLPKVAAIYVSADGPRKGNRHLNLATTALDPAKPVRCGDHEPLTGAG